MLLGGVDGQAIAGGASAFFDRAVTFVDHIWHELEDGDVMTWLAFAAMFLAVTIFVGVYRGTIRIVRGGQ